MSTEEKSEPAPIIINGRRFPMWEQFVHRKAEWIGGTLTDDDEPGEPTIVTDITGRLPGRKRRVHGIR